MALGANIRSTRNARGMTLDQLSAASGVDIGTISALENRDSARSIYASKLAEALGVPLEILVATTPPEARESALTPYLQAQDLSQLALMVVPTIKWESIMRQELPSRFEVVVPDDSMAPRVRAGQRVTLSTQETARPGDGVLVSDAHGAVYLRLYRQRRTDAWEAHPLNEAYQALDSERDQLQVLAVLVGVSARWG